MKRIFLTLVFVLAAFTGLAQKEKQVTENKIKPRLNNAIPADIHLANTPVKNQSMTGTCWSFGTTSLIESQCLKNNVGELDLSEMFTVRNTYIEKAKNYILRQGHTQFGEGGLGHDMIHAMEVYGALPESAYSGLVNGNKMHNHQKMFGLLKEYLDSTLKTIPIPANWLEGYVKILDDNMGTPPATFTYEGREISPQMYAQRILKFNAADYVNITSFTHQPYYKPFILQVPDNFSNGSFYNMPLNDMITLTKSALQKGNTVLWDADVSNTCFHQEWGYALLFKDGRNYTKEEFTPESLEKPYDEKTRQDLFENLTTQDDHLMHIVGYEKTNAGKEFFLVKNSWGNIGPFKGYIKVSVAYFAMNTISLVLPKAAFSNDQLSQLEIR